MLRSVDKALLHAGRPRLGLLSDGFRGPRPGKVVQGGANLATTRGAIVTSGAVNAKGNWTEIEDALPFDADGFFFCHNVSSARRHLWFDVGVGAAAAEVVLVPDIPLTGNVGGQAQGHPFIPMHISGGSRVAVRSQSATATSVADIQLIFVASEQYASMSCRRATAYGHVAASTTSDCQPDPNNTAHTKGPYDELVASTTNPMKSWIFFVTSNGTSFGSARFYLFDLATGAAGSEVVLLGDMYEHQEVTNDAFNPPHWGPIFIPIPAGTRLSARAQSGNANDGPVTYCYVLGFD